MNTIQWISAACFILGSLLLMISCLGVMRLPDTFCRSHALAKSMPLAINLMLLGAWLILDESESFKVLLALIFQAITIPLSGHILALTAFKNRVPRWKEQSPISK